MNFDKETLIQSQKIGRNILLSLLIGLFISFATLLYINAVEVGPSNALANLDSLLRLRSGLIIVLCILATGAVFFFRKKLFPLIFKYRWVIALSAFALCVLFEISGSSIGILIGYMDGADSVFFGQSRPIRSDEWMVFTPMALSQCTTDGGVFSYFQDSMRATETDMFCVYGQPVWDIAELFRPFQWGYLLFGASRGLAFFWSGRLIFLFMVSFEFCYKLIAKDSKPLSIAYAFMITFAGAIQWWFSICGLVEMLIFGQFALILANLYLDSKSYKVRLLCSLGISWCLGIFILTFYPAWQIPFAYIFIALLVSLLITKLPKSYKNYKDILLCILTIFIVVFVVMYVFLFKSWDTIQATMNTAYPGQRTSTGGNSLISLFYYPLSILTPLSDINISPNVCEVSSFYTLFPLSVILPIAIMVKERKLNIWITCLLIVFLLVGIYISIGLPDFLANITLLSKTTAKRAAVPLEYLLVLLLFFSIPKIKVLDNKDKAIIALLSMVVLAVGFIYFESNIGKTRILICLLIAFILITALLLPLKKIKISAICTSLVVVSLLSGALVNPIRMGIEGYFNNNVSKSIEKNSSDETVWASIDTPFIMNNIPASLGYKTLNSTNTYPQLDTWYKIDPTHKYEDIYNRYAHIALSLTDEETGFDLIHGDSISVKVTIDDLQKLGVTNLMTYGKQLDNPYCEEIDQANGFYFYQLKTVEPM